MTARQPGGGQAGPGSAGGGQAPERVGPAVDGITRVEIDACITLYSPVSRKVVALNAPASDVWRLCDGSRTLAELVDELASDYACAPHDIAGEVAEIVAGLRATGCLRG